MAFLRQFSLQILEWRRKTTATYFFLRTLSTLKYHLFSPFNLLFFRLNSPLSSFCRDLIFHAFNHCNCFPHPPKCRSPSGAWELSEGLATQHLISAEYGDSTFHASLLLAQPSIMFYLTVCLKYTPKHTHICKMD